MRRSKSKPSFSKVLIIVMLAVTALITGFAVYLMLRTGDLSPLAYLIPAIFTELAAATGFYYWKSKNENRSKYAMELVKELADKYGIDNVVSIAEVVLKD